jgi:hypothetical protein
VNFLAPLFLAGSAAVAVPIVLHLLKREPEPRVKFPAVKLLMHAPVEDSENRRLRQWLLLALRVTALLLLAVAFARPFIASGSALSATGVTMIALDTSYSMSAPGRFARAQQLARAAVARAPAGSLVGVVTFDDGARVAAKPSGDRVLASSAIDEARPGFGGTRYRAGIAAASQALAGRAGTIVVVTDLQENGWDAGDRVAVGDTTRIEVADVGPPDHDLAVTSLRVLADRAVATIRGTGARPAVAHVRLFADGKPAGDASAPVAAGSTVDVPLPFSGQPSTVSVAVDDRDGLQANNVRYAVAGAAGRSSVVIVTGNGDLGKDAFYLQAALEAGAPGAGAYEAVGVSGGQLSSWTAARLASAAAVIVASTRGLEQRGRELLASYVKEGGGLIVPAGAAVDGDVMTSVLGGATLRVSAPGQPPQRRTLAPADIRHPIFRGFGANAAALALVQFQRVSSIGGASCQTVARFTSGEAALLDCPSGDGRALVFASDLDNSWNDFPRHASFVPFVHEAVRYVASSRTIASDYTVDDAPAGVPRAPGIATIADPSGRRRQVAVNVDPRESDPERLSADEFQAAVMHLKDAGAAEARVEAREQEDRQHLWQYAMIVMLLVLAAEGVVAGRTV